MYYVLCSVTNMNPLPQQVTPEGEVAECLPSHPLLLSGLLLTARSAAPLLQVGESAAPLLWNSESAASLSRSLLL